MSEKLTIEQNLSLLLETKTKMKENIIASGGTINDDTPFIEYVKYVSGSSEGGASGYAIEVSTHEEMDALLVEANLNKLYKYVGESDDTYVNGQYYIIVESDTVQFQPLSAGSGVVKIERKGTGIQAVPNSGLVEKLVFNTELTTSEVDTIISNANLNWVQPSSTEPPLYFVFFNMEVEAALMIMNYGILIGEGVIAYMIMAVIPGGESDPIPIYSSSIIKELLGGIEGWNTALFEELGSNVFPLNAMAESNMEGMPIGAQNESIKELINIGGLEPYLKELKGTYEPVDVNVTENTTIDLVTQYMDNKQMPITLNVQTTKGIIDITNNGEHDVSKYEKANVNVTVLPALQEKTVNAYTSTQVVTPDSGYNGLSKVTINPVTSSIDSDIKAENIKSGVNILGVVGTHKPASLYTSPLTEIPDKCFNNFNGISGISASNATSFGAYAFSGCSNLETVNIHEKNKSFGAQCFYDCDNLKNLNIYTTLENWMDIEFINNFSNPSCNFNNDSSIYLYNGYITSLEIPEGVTEIKKFVFYNWNRVITTLTLPSTLSYFNDGCFGGTSLYNKLNSVYIDTLEHLLSIDHYVNANGNETNGNPLQFNPILYINNVEFDGNLVIPTTITEIKPHSFDNYTKLKTVKFHENITSLGDYCFRSTSLTEVTLPTSITTLGNCFTSCKSLNTLNFDNIQEIVDFALYDTGFINVELKNLSTINAAVFQQCANLEKVDIHIATTIGLLAFNTCPKLKTLIIRTPSQVCTLASTKVLTGTPIASGTGYVYVPDNLVDSYKADKIWSTYANQIKPLSEYVE